MPFLIQQKHKPAWRNGLARWTSNPKVVGSNPTVGAFERKIENSVKKNKTGLEREEVLFLSIQEVILYYICDMWTVEDSIPGPTMLERIV